MKVVQLRIGNFRGIRQFTFYPDVRNVLLGQVNAGKSTILNAMAMVLDPDISRRYQAITELDIYGMNRLDTERKPIPVEVEVTLADLSDAERSHFVDHLEAWDESARKLIAEADEIATLDEKRHACAVRMAFHAAYDPDEDGILSSWTYPKHAHADQELVRCPRTDREKVGFFLIPAERDVQRTLGFGRYSTLDRALKADNLSLLEQIGKMAAQVKGQAQVLFEKTEFAALVKEVEEYAERQLRLRPGEERKILYELTSLSHYDIASSLRPFVHFDGKDRAYPVSVQGMGAKQILALAALRMLSKRRGGAILAVEEPELGLHPHMQRSLVSDLSCAPCQIFVTTHSAHVADALGTKHVYCIVPTGNGVVEARHADVDSAVLEPKDKKKVRKLNAHHPAETATALFASAVLLVEGPADRSCLPVLFRSLGMEAGSSVRDDSAMDLTIIPGEGKDDIPFIATYYRKHLLKRTLCLLDGNRERPGDVEKCSETCDTTFVWPAGWAIEQALVDGASDTTIDQFVAYVIDELDDQRMRDLLQGSPNGRLEKPLLIRYLHNRPADHRLFAGMLPTSEIPRAVRNLLAQVNGAVLNDQAARVVRLTN